MIRSMTAFARQDLKADFGAISWEIRSVNHRYLEANVRLPEDIRVLEPKVRALLSERLGRGKVECNFSYKTQSVVDQISLNKKMATQISEICAQVASLQKNPDRVSPIEIMRWPGVLENPGPNMAELSEQALILLDKAVGEIIETREREGEKLKQAIAERIEAMAEIVVVVRKRLPDILEWARTRLKKRFEELDLPLDDARLEQEMVIATQKMDVEEELKRLEMHIEEVGRILLNEDDKPVGRRLDFLMQELNREANTLCSKSMDTETTRAGIDLKVYIEQMREQVQNIE